MGYCFHWVCILRGDMLHDSPSASLPLSRPHAVFLRLLLCHHVLVQHDWMVVDPYRQAPSWINFPFPDHVFSFHFPYSQSFSLYNTSLLLYGRSHCHNSIPRGCHPELLHHCINHPDPSSICFYHMLSSQLALPSVPIRI